jgi:chaperone BCS1
LFWGIPGSGKTSFVRALASHLNRNIAIVKNIINIDDNELDLMIEELPKDSIILFEDIDSLFQGRVNVANTRLTFSGLLNFLDGIMDYDRLIIIITTNNFGNIDDAVRRRVDMFVEFGYIKEAEVIEMYLNFFPNDTPEVARQFAKTIDKCLTANTLEKFFIKCIVQKKSPIDSLDILTAFIDTYNKNKIGSSLYG